MKTVEGVQNFIKEKTNIIFEISEPLITKEVREPVALAILSNKIPAATDEGYVQVRMLLSITKKI